MEAVFGAIIGVFIIGVLVASVFMWIGAKMAGIKNASFGKSIGVAIATGLITWIITAVFSIVPIIGTAIGFFVGLFFALFVIKSIYATSFGKALLAWIFNIFAQIVAIIIALYAGIGGIKAILQKF